MASTVLAALMAAAALPAMAAPSAFKCNFTTECFEAENCSDTAFDIDVDVAGMTVTTGFGDLMIVAVRQNELLTTIFATGVGAEYLLSLTPDAARLSTHNNAGPEVISYLGRCEGAF